MTRRVNQTTGQEEELVGNEWRPVTTASPLSVSSATPEGQVVDMTNRPMPSNGGFGYTPTPHVAMRRAPMIPGTADRATRGEALAADVLDWSYIPFTADWNHNVMASIGNVGIDVENWLNVPNPGASGSSSELGSTFGAAAGQRGAEIGAQQPLAFGDGILPEDQAYIDALTQLQSTVGNTTPITAPQLPEVPAAAFEVDPGLQRLVEHSQNRQGQVDQLISQLRGDREGEVGRATSKWMTLARWLGQVAQADDLSQGGVIMERVLRDNQDMRDELRQETLQYIQMGMSAEDAVIQAQVALLSGQAQARREQAMAGYNRDTAQTQLDFNASVANTEASGRGATARANAAVAIAEAQRDIAARGREQRNRTAEIFSQDPRYSRQAFGEIAGNVTGDQRTADALTGVMSQQQESLALMNYIVSAQGSRDRTALQFLRQWDPTLNEDALRRSTPQALMMRLTQSPQSRGAFARNRDMLIRSMQFGGMQPAQ